MVVTSGKQWSISHVCQGRESSAAHSDVCQPGWRRNQLMLTCEGCHPQDWVLVGHGFHPVIILNGKPESAWSRETGRRGTVGPACGPDPGLASCPAEAAPNSSCLVPGELSSLLGLSPGLCSDARPSALPPPTAHSQLTSFPEITVTICPGFSTRGLILLFPQLRWF